jgi:formylglycine-generating enzyme required for sulfatase activity
MARHSASRTARRKAAQGVLLLAVVTSMAACAEGEASTEPRNAAAPPPSLSASAASPVPDATTSPGAASTRNSVGMDFVAVPAGTFVMGAGASDRDAIDAERPAHEVTISQPFEIARLEVTQEQWEQVMGSNPYTLDRSNPYYNRPGMAERITRPEHPATVSWNDAQSFLEALNAREGGAEYRLPTEAEWEYAARAGTTTAYSFGEDASQFGRYAWTGEDFTTGGTHPVGTKLPNRWGLHDVHGNAWEWVQDFYGADYYRNSPATDPAGPTSGGDHVVRGGSWHITGDGWRSAARRDYAPDYRGISIGFRVVRDSTPQVS